MTQSVAKERGRRLKICRNLANCSLQHLSSIYKMSISGLAKWERGELLISEKNAPKIVNMLVSEGVLCTEQWLLHGLGNAPTVSGGVAYFQSKVSSDPDISDISPQLAIFSEIEFFKRHNKGSILKTVPDESMHPLFKMGDYVGGIEIHPEDYEKANGEYVIVELESGQIFIRQFFIHQGKIVLIALNMGGYPNPFFLDLPPKRLCPIVFHRKVLFHLSRKLLNDTAVEG